MDTSAMCGKNDPYMLKLLEGGGGSAKGEEALLGGGYYLLYKTI